MKRVKIYNLITLIIISMFFTACTAPSNEANSEPGTETETTENQIGKSSNEASSENETSTDAGLCANEYYPIDTDTKREYKNSANSAGNIVLAQIKNEGNTFTEKRETDSGAVTTSNWVCTEEGLRHGEFNNGTDFSGGNFKMETLESSGITLPKEWEVGKKWSSEYKVNAKLNAGPASGGSKGTIKIDNELVSLNDKVTTPAGDFEAAKIVSNIKINLSGRSVDTKMTVWYAPKVGIVKQEVKSPFGPPSTMEYVGEKN